MALNIISAHNFLGKPKIPEEIAGIESDLHYKFAACSKVFVIHEYKSLGSPS